MFPVSCPVKCFRTDPVCGVDGVTYWCCCRDALCAGTHVANLGFCEVGNGANGPLPGQALLLVQIVWLVLLGFIVLFGLLWTTGASCFSPYNGFYYYYYYWSIIIICIRFLTPFSIIQIIINIQIQILFFILVFVSLLFLLIWFDFINSF